MITPQVRLARSEYDSHTIQNEINRALDQIVKLIKKSGAVLTDSPTASEVKGLPDVSEGEIRVFNHSGEGKSIVLKSDGNVWNIRLSQQSSQQSMTALTDSSGGTAADEVVAISGSGADSDINNNFASIAEDINELRTILVNLDLVS